MREKMSVCVFSKEKHPAIDFIESIIIDNNNN
jgi:hypothetical protein